MLVHSACGKKVKGSETVRDSGNVVAESEKAHQPDEWFEVGCNTIGSCSVGRRRKPHALLHDLRALDGIFEGVVDHLDRKELERWLSDCIA